MDLDFKLVGFDVKLPGVVTGLLSQPTIGAETKTGLQPFFLEHVKVLYYLGITLF